ncbi:uncharacterized protein METZ01_LOCUS217607, partial [marine metagenome]
CLPNRLNIEYFLGAYSSWSSLLSSIGSPSKLASLWKETYFFKGFGFDHGVSGHNDPK